MLRWPPAWRSERQAGEGRIAWFGSRQASSIGQGMGRVQRVRRMLSSSGEFRGAALMRTIFVLAIMWSIGIPTTGPLAAQTCDGIQVDVGKADRRCLQPGAGQTFRDCSD